MSGLLKRLIPAALHKVCSVSVNLLCVLWDASLHVEQGQQEGAAVPSPGLRQPESSWLESE